MSEREELKKGLGKAHIEAMRRQWDQDLYPCNAEFYALCNMALAALSAQTQQEPVAWAVFADNGNIRIWTADASMRQTYEAIHGPMMPLYTAPPSGVRGVDAEPPHVRVPNYKALYYDLIMQVGAKWPDESRHDTAKRYIINAERPSEDAATGKESE